MNTNCPSTGIGVTRQLSCKMVKVKVTDKKDHDELCVAHPCRYPSSDRVFNHRQGMSRHMKLVHSAVAGTFPPVTVARTVVRTMASTTIVAKLSTNAEGLMDAFQGCGDPDLIKDDIATLGTLKFVWNGLTSNEMV